MKLTRSAGVLLHPTAFPGRFGIGDFGESAYQFVDFLAAGKQKLWQILPLGPTSFGDSPYQSFSTFAGNYLLLSPVSMVKEGYLSEEDLRETPDFSDDKIDYGRVLAYKKELFQKAYRGFQKNATKKQKTAYDKFCYDKKAWLPDYCLFVALKEHFIEERKKAGMSQAFRMFEKRTAAFLEENIQKDYYFGAVFSTWPRDIASRQKSAVISWKKRLSKEMGFYAFLQYEFFRQWSQLKDYANKKGIQIIGDIPIFVAYDSADVWTNPELFYLDTHGFPTLVAGVPPDYFSATGQLWGNPLYRFDAHKKEGYAWWISRFQQTLSLVDIVRIDHFRGFESYWAVPFGDKTAENGKWNKGPGADLFRAVKKALGELPIIAEDLGIITEEVEDLRDSLGFPGMRVLQFAFDDSENNEYLPHNYIKNAVVYTGTHDNNTTLGWYQEAPEQEKDRCRRYMNISGQDIAWDMIRLAVSSTAAFAVYPLQDVLSLPACARMNTPSVPSGNWQFRYRQDDLKQDYANGLAYLAELFKR